MMIRKDNIVNSQFSNLLVPVQGIALVVLTLQYCFSLMIHRLSYVLFIDIAKYP